MNPYEQLDKAVNDLAQLTGAYKALEARVERLEQRQAKAFGPEQKNGTTNTLHLPQAKR